MSKKRGFGAMPMMDKDYQAEDDARTMKRAHEVASDKGRVKAAHGHIQKEIAAMQAVVGKGSPKKAGGSSSGGGAGIAAHMRKHGMG